MATVTPPGGGYLSSTSEVNKQFGASFTFTRPGAITGIQYFQPNTPATAMQRTFKIHKVVSGTPTLLDTTVATVNAEVVGWNTAPLSSGGVVSITQADVNDPTVSFVVSMASIDGESFATTNGAGNGGQCATTDPTRASCMTQQESTRIVLSTAAHLSRSSVVACRCDTGH